MTLPALAVALCGTLLVPAPVVPADEPAEILSTAYEDGTLNGAALVWGRRLFAHQAGGWFDARGERRHDTGSRFPLASLSKLLTQATVLRLTVEERLDLDAPLAELVPELDPAVIGRITVRQLLLHRSGLPRELADDPRRSGVTLDEEGRVLPFLVGRPLPPLAHAPGERQSYSNVGYWLLGAVVEAVTGEPFGHAMQRLVCEPLDLGDTFLLTTTGNAPDFARGLMPGHAGPTPAEHLDYSRRYTSGGMVSTTSDLAALCNALDREDLFGRHGVSVFHGDDGKLVLGGNMPGHTNALYHDLSFGVSIVLLNNVSITPPDRLLSVLDRLAKAAGGRAVRGNDGPLIVESAAGGLPDTPLCNTASALVQAIGRGDRVAVQAWLAERSTLPADEHSQPLLGLPDELDGWDLVGYLQRSDAELLLIVRGDNAFEARMTLLADSARPDHVVELDVDVAGRGR